MAARVKTLHRLLLATIAVVAAQSVAAQNSAAPRTLPGLDDFSLPSSRPVPRASPTPEPTTNPRPVASATPRPAASQTPRAGEPPRLIPTVRATPPPERTATPQPRANPIAVPTVATPPGARPTQQPAMPVALPTLQPEPSARPAPAPAPTTVAQPAPPLPADTAPFTIDLWMWLTIGAGVVGLAAAGVSRWWRKRALRDDAAPRDDRQHEIFMFEAKADEGPAPDAALIPAAAQPRTSRIAPAATPQPLAPELPFQSINPPSVAPPASGPPVAPRATLELECIARRAGTNLLSAAIDYSLVIRNSGALAASGVRLDVRMLSAGARQDALLAALFTGAILNPVTLPFDLPADGAVELGGMALHPKETLEVMEASGRMLFVPVLAVNLTYAWDGGSGQTARSFVIGIDRGGDAKLQPFRFDAAARMHENVSALEYTVSAVS